MLNAKNMDYINTVLKGVRCNSDPFGGLQILLFGDFFQLPPVKTNIFCFESEAWKELNTIPVILKTVYRQDNIHFVEALNNARDFLGYNNVSVSVPESKGVKDTTKWAKYLYTQAQPIKNTLAETYLKIYRGIPEIPTESCRFLPAVNNYESKNIGRFQE